VLEKDKLMREGMGKREKRRQEKKEKRRKEKRKRGS
jgi:hypothetical protein